MLTYYNDYDYFVCDFNSNSKSNWNVSIPDMEIWNYLS